MTRTCAAPHRRGLDGSFEGVGLTPDVEIVPDEALARAMEILGVG